MPEPRRPALNAQERNELLQADPRDILPTQSATFLQANESVFPLPAGERGKGMRPGEGAMQSPARLHTTSQGVRDSLDAHLASCHSPLATAFLRGCEPLGCKRRLHAQYRTDDDDYGGRGGYRYHPKPCGPPGLFVVGHVLIGTRGAVGVAQSFASQKLCGPSCI